jgi:hypothetical protein
MKESDLKESDLKELRLKGGIALKAKFESWKQKKKSLRAKV